MLAGVEQLRRNTLRATLGDVVDAGAGYSVPSGIGGGLSDSVFAGSTIYWQAQYGDTSGLDFNNPDYNAFRDYLERRNYQNVKLETYGIFIWTITVTAINGTTRPRYSVIQDFRDAATAGDLGLENGTDNLDVTSSPTQPTVSTHTPTIQQQAVNQQLQSRGIDPNSVQRDAKGDVVLDLSGNPKPKEKTFADQLKDFTDSIGYTGIALIAIIAFAFKKD
jgi:hypothetical protein